MLGVIKEWREKAVALSGDFIQNQQTMAVNDAGSIKQ